MNKELLGMLIITAVLGYCWFFGPAEDEHGHYKPGAYAIAIGLMFLLGSGIWLLL